MSKDMEALVATASVPVLAAPEADSDLVTELISGEVLEVTESKPGFLGVVVPSHRSRLDARGYPGWASSDSALRPADGWSPGLIVAEPNRAGLPLGSLVRDADEEATIRLGEGSRRSEVEISSSLLGLPYRWGGTDSTTGMDCSGMVYRVMQLRGVSVPRDADDQFDYAPFASREHWEKAGEGDLVFFGEEKITHVGFYLGDGAYISEHGSGGTMVRAMTDDTYRGFARYAS